MPNKSLAFVLDCYFTHKLSYLEYFFLNQNKNLKLKSFSKYIIKKKTEILLKLINLSKIKCLVS